MKKLLFFGVFVTFLSASLGSFCGDSAIPYSFEALPNGQPVLGCARPTCFGRDADGKKAGSSAFFYRINWIPDGHFVQPNETARTVPLNDVPNFKPQIAKCSVTFDSEQCSTKNQWVGGISPLLRPELPISLQCCEYDKLELSEDQGVAVVNAGQIVVGGEIVKNGRQYAFDYISDVLKHVNPDGVVSYDVTIRRFPCLPYPTEFAVNVGENVAKDLILNIEKVGKTPEKPVDGSQDLKKPFKIQASTTIKIRPINSDPINGAQLISNKTVRIYPVKTAPEPTMSMFNMGLPYPAVPNPVIAGPFKAESDE
uniref:Uncharacterized protein n=1 Tax=Panagrolaimus sp. JU765 TaxID=591449 RepID=A0AC34RLG3_9BILA